MIDGQIHVLLVAKRDIKPGELLMFDYNGLDNNYPTDHFVWLVCLIEQNIFYVLMFNPLNESLQSMSCVQSISYRFLTKLGKVPLE